jgi:xanthine/uracil permease
MTTYAENIGVMAVTRIYSTLIFIIAAIVAILLGFSPKFGALIATIPQGVLGGLAIVLFGLIAATGGRIWVQNQVDFSKSRNLITAAVALTMGAGNFTLTIGNFTMGGIATATFSAIIIYQILREREPKPEEMVAADSAVGLNPTEPQAGAGK